MKIAEVSENNATIVPCLVMSVVKKNTKVGTPYSCLKISDGTDSIEVNYFKYKTDKDVDGIINSFSGNTADITLRKNRGFIDVENLVLREDYDKNEFVKAAPQSSEDMYDEITNMLSELTNPIKNVALYFYAKNKDNILKWAGGQKMHHDVYGGLLYHTERMMKLADGFCNAYPVLDRDILLIATSIHDIGKLVEFETDEMGNVEYTKAGSLEGHLYIGAKMFKETVNEVEVLNNIRFSDEQVDLIEHMILSHHDKGEYGAVREPFTYEAYTLAYIDNFDARAYAYEDDLRKTEPGTFSDKDYRLDNRKVYHPLGE